MRRVIRWRELESRIARLEKVTAVVPKVEIIIGSFALYEFSLPEGTVVPEGGRVVKDFFCTHEPPDPDACRFGYWRERITFDPKDQGRTRPASEDEMSIASDAGND